MKIEMMQLVPVENFRKDESTYVVTGTGWRADLQKYCLRLARWAGASDQKPYVEYSRVTIDTTDIIAACQDQIYHIYKSYGGRPSQIIVGKAEYYRLCVAMAANFTLRDNESISYVKNGERHKLSLNGVAITVNPFMEGIVVVP